MNYHKHLVEQLKERDPAGVLGTAFSETSLNHSVLAGGQDIAEALFERTFGRKRSKIEHLVWRNTERAHWQNYILSREMRYYIAKYPNNVLFFSTVDLTERNVALDGWALHSHVYENMEPFALGNWLTTAMLMLEPMELYENYTRDHLKAE